MNTQIVEEAVASMEAAGVNLMEVRTEAEHQLDRDYYASQVYSGQFKVCPACSARTPGDQGALEILDMHRHDFAERLINRPCDCDEEHETETLYFASNGYREHQPLTGPWDSEEEAQDDINEAADKVHETFPEQYVHRGDYAVKEKVLEYLHLDDDDDEREHVEAVVAALD